MAEKEEIEAIVKRARFFGRSDMMSPKTVTHWVDAMPRKDFDRLVGLAREAASLREDALTPKEAKICRAYTGAPWDAEEEALVAKLSRIASRLTAGSPEQEKPRGCNCGGSDEAGHKGTCPEVF